ncbi:GNAT family N-acetyltransferase [Streptococcus sp. E17BB]|uniref:GNAT family N-acetyltransferase n=1 Tax=Streptococcus sp. E17BB TaxID=3278714 RepID=UPI00359CC08D
MIKRLEKPESIAHLFNGWEQVLLTACLTGQMGDVWGDQSDNPQSVLARIGQFGAFGFLAGEPLLNLVEHCHGQDIILVPTTDAWANLIEHHYGEKAHGFTRYAMIANQFDQARLRILADGLPDGYRLEYLNDLAYDQCLREPWSRDLVGNFPTATAYAKDGLGVVIWFGDAVVAGASSYARTDDAIEIDISTHPDHRLKGLATVVAARLILRCLEQGLSPSWDAHTLISRQLAEKLSYGLNYPYQAYEISWEI